MPLNVFIGYLISDIMALLEIFIESISMSCSKIYCSSSFTKTFFNPVSTTLWKHLGVFFTQSYPDRSRELLDNFRVCQHSEIDNFRIKLVWNKIFQNKSIAKDHWVRNKLTEYKIFVLKNPNRVITR